MSGIRKYSRYKAAHDIQKKTTTKISLWEMLMIAGGALLLIGVIWGVLYYTTYTAGRPEQILDSAYRGRIYLPEKAPGDPEQKLLAYISLVTASTGSLLLIVSVPAYVIGKIRKQANNAMVSL